MGLDRQIAALWQQNIVIMKEREAPLNYQIAVSNVTRIASKSMADYYVLFASQTSANQWKSPLIHGKITKENTRFPWTFTSDTHQMTVTFHELDGGMDSMVGSMPLLLMRREGEEEFLIFGCTQANRGRKVAEVDFTYTQCSAAVSLPSNPSNQESKRVSLEYTIEVQNYDSKKQLNMIPEQPENSRNKESITNIKMPEDSLVDERDFHPSRLDTLKVQSYRPRGCEDSNFQLNLIRQMEDATDRWYRKNFGREKPSDIQHCDIEDSRAILRYERSFEYLNELSFTAPHMQLKNLMLLTDKLPQAVELYCIDLDGSQLLKQKVASLEVEGHRYNWPNAVRLPKDKKAYGLEVITADKERLQGIIIKDANSKHVVDIYDKSGQRVGRGNYTIKQIHKIQIQTMEIMQLDPVPQEKQLSNELDKSFLKTTPNRPESLMNQLLNSQNQPSFRNKHNLIKDIYLNRSREEQPHQPQPHKSIERDYVPTTQERRYISNHAYLSNNERSLPKSKEFRRNRYEIPQEQSRSVPKQSRPVETKSQISQVPFIQVAIPSKQYTAKLQQREYATPSQASANSANEFLPESSRNQTHEITEKGHSEGLNKKIEQLKKLGSDLGKRATTFPAKKFTKNAKYKTVIYNEDEEDMQYEGRRSLEHSDSGKQLQNHKKSYREPINAGNSSIPINATPSFQSLLVNNTFSNDLNKPTRKNNAELKLKKQIERPPQPVTHNSQLNSSDPQQNDDSEEVPIVRHKTADQNVLKTMILQKQALMNQKKQKQAKGSEFGVNTERMTIVPNVLQSFIAPTPTTPTQKRNSPQLQDLKSIDYENWLGKRSVKQQMGSMRESIMGNSNQTKYSTQTIQPATQMPAGKLNFLITSISINYYQNSFGSKFVKIYVPNRHYYETSQSTNANSFFWKCNGFLFSRIHDHQDVYLQLINSDGNGQRMIGRLILNTTQFKPGVEQAVIRAYLVLESKIVGEAVVGYEAVGKSKEIEAEGKKETVSLDQVRLGRQKKESTTPIKRKKGKRREPSLNDSLTKFLRKNRKEKINRYMVNEYSRAHIESHITTSVPRKFTAGKNIVIGRDVRFPLSVEQQHKIAVPGPGAYRQLSQFQRYK